MKISGEMAQQQGYCGQQILLDDSLKGFLKGRLDS